MIKLIFCLKRLPGISQEEFARYWNNEHSEVIKEVAGALAIRRNVHNVSVATDLDAQLRNGRQTLSDDYDGVAESWFDSIAALKAAVASPEGRAAARRVYEDEMKFVDFSQSKLFFVDETVAFNDIG